MTMKRVAAAAAVSVAVLGSLLAGPASAATSSAPAVAPAAAAKVLHRRVSAYPEPYGLVVTYKYKKGSRSRTVGWVYASKDTRAKSGAARWSYSAGGSRHVTGWRSSTARHSGKGWRGVSWGDVGANTKRVAAGSKVCAQFKGSHRWTCVKVK